MVFMDLLKSVKFLFIELITCVFGIRRKFLQNTRIDGKVVVITGANTGIGKETAYLLSLRGATIIIGCRDLKKAENAIKDIKQRNPNANITAIKLDLSSLKSVRHFAKALTQREHKIDILINNAGVALCPEAKTTDGFEIMFGTNHLGHFLLTLLLLPLLKKAEKARIVTVASIAHLFGEINFENINLRNGAFDKNKAYAQSKLANILFTRELARRLGDKSTVKAYCLHPGAVKTDGIRHLKSTSPIKIIAKIFLNVEQGSQTTLYCALDASLGNESGFYYDNCIRIDNMVSRATDDESAEKLWHLSCDLVKLDNSLKI